MAKKKPVPSYQVRSLKWNEERHMWIGVLHSGGQKFPIFRQGGWKIRVEPGKAKELRFEIAEAIQKKILPLDKKRYKSLDHNERLRQRAVEMNRRDRERERRREMEKTENRRQGKLTSKKRATKRFKKVDLDDLDF